MIRFALVCLLAVSAACAQAGTGVTQIDSTAGPVTVFYPTAADDAPLNRGPFKLNLAANAVPVKGNGRLVVISHGSAGAAWTFTDLARQLVQAGYIVASPEHQADNWRDFSEMGPRSWKRRPLEISQAIDTMTKDARFAPLFAHDSVGVFGMSAGGHTALTLAGGRWSPSRLMKHCQAHIDDDFQTCAGPAAQLQGDAFDSVKKLAVSAAVASRLDDPQWYSHSDPRITVIVAEVPFAIDFDMASLAAPKTKLGIVQLGQDKWLAPRFHSALVLEACKSCELVADLPGAGHGSLMSPQPVGLGGVIGTLLADPPGFDRAEVPPAHAKIVSFFNKHLRP